jgi:hypothetical protein
MWFQVAYQAYNFYEELTVFKYREEKRRWTKQVLAKCFSLATRLHGVVFQSIVAYITNVDCFCRLMKVAGSPNGPINN